MYATSTHLVAEGPVAVSRFALAADAIVCGTSNTPKTYLFVLEWCVLRPRASRVGSSVSASAGLHLLHMEHYSSALQSMRLSDSGDSMVSAGLDCSSLS